VPRSQRRSHHRAAQQLNTSLVDIFFIERGLS
jgi:hypothetical protein